jgi:hypothetical protein
MAADFPNSPTNGQTYTSGVTTWVYDSTKTAWSVQSTGSRGYTGSLGGTGYTGSQGIIGFTGSVGLGSSIDTQVLFNDSGTAAGSTLLTINKTANTVNTPGTSVVRNTIEQANVTATAMTGTINIDITGNTVVYFTANSTANWGFNLRANSTVTMDNFLANNQATTITIMVSQGATAYYPNAHLIDSTSVTPKWQGGTAPTSGDASSINAYTYSIIKTAPATYTVLASATRFA